MDDERPRTSAFPTWEGMKMDAYLNFIVIVTDRFGGRLDQVKLFEGAMKHLKGYYERGIQKPHRIKEFKGWFYKKCKSALRDERRQLLIRKKTERPIVLRLEKNVGTRKHPCWKQAVPLEESSPSIEQDPYRRGATLLDTLRNN